MVRSLLILIYMFYRCLPDSDRECPQCAVQHRMISEIRRAQEENAEKHDLFFEQVIKLFISFSFVFIIHY